ncbi:MAG TPA: dihydrofolate reductase family protein [Bryobacteraceae bacterium]|jgi:riboflavin biosynthesis pyrimidine reductase|nr:dihydrofolate reductase family protein [Bryobacteraceae bacterium]
MDPLRTLLDRQADASPATLPPDLAAFYDGDLRFPEAPPDRPYIIANFVTTLDGVVSFHIPGQSGGGEISGFDSADRLLMGLLRASADAVLVGAATLHEAPRGHLFVAGVVCPEAIESYRRYHPGNPLNVIVSGSGHVDLERAVFRTPQVKTLLITTPAGAEVLAARGVRDLASTAVRVFPPVNGVIPPAAVVEMLRREFQVGLLLLEGGPALFGQFVAAGCVDELFLTLAPQFAGRDDGAIRPGLTSGVTFTPATAPWLNLVSVKQRGQHLYLRYRRRVE